MIALKALLLLCLIGSALACPDNCIECDPLGNICFVCNEGFELSITGSCLDENTIPKCTLYGPTGQCFVCQSTYSLDQATGQCEKDYKACLTYQPADDTRCSDCGFGTVLSNGQCQGAINCDQSQNPCTECKQGFTLRDGQCMDETGRCAEVGEEGICMRCNDEFKMVGYECVPDEVSVGFCYIYDEEAKCHLCKSGFELFQDYCFLPRQIVEIQNGDTNIETILAERDNIRITTTTTTTTTVTTPTTQPTNGFGSDGFGGGFDNGFGDFGGGNDFGGGGFNNGGAFTTQEDVFCQVPDGFNQGNCLSCVDRYYPDSQGRCAQVSPYCEAYNRQNGDCITCRFSTNLSNGRCLDSRCLNQGFSGCNQCQQFFRPSTTASAGYCQYSDPNCLSPSLDRCNNCAGGYFLTFQGMCMVLPASCIAANIQTFTCIQCEIGYAPNQFGDCIVSNPPIPNCINQQGPTCLQCAPGFQNISNICYPLPFNCVALNIAQPQLCQTCVSGYSLINGECLQQTQPQTPNCQSYNLLTGECVICLPGFQLMNRQCMPLPPNCQQMDSQQVCILCLPGYTPQNGACVADGGNVVPNCLTYNVFNNICVECVAGFDLLNDLCYPLPPNCMRVNQANPTFCGTCMAGYDLVNGVCQQGVDPNCINYNPATNTCLECRQGFEPVGSRCVGSGRRDPNCARYTDGICEDCSNRYYFGPEGICFPVNPLCNDYDSSGACLSCYPGYTLDGPNCIITRIEDPFCKEEENGICIECYSGYYYNRARGACQPLNPLCKTSNLFDGSCTSCFPGYSLTAGLCGIAFQDPNCKDFNDDRTVCEECSTRFYPGPDGRCVQINPLCRTANPLNGACLTCYPGYVLQGVTCAISRQENTDVNCAERQNGICIDCYQGHFLNRTTARCQQVNILCRTSDDNGACLSCYPGYDLIGVNCLVSDSSTGSGDPNCRQTNLNQICLECFSGYYLTTGRRCQRMDPLCRTYTDNNASCTTCYEGYSQLNGQCIISTQVPDANNDPYCIRAQGQRCIECAQGYYMDQQGVCIQLNPLCRTSDMTNGACLTCYEGYEVSGITCVVAAPANIPYCVTVRNRFCVECINGYYTDDGGCSLANTLCATYDPTNGDCFSCVPGYVFQEGECIYPSMGVDPQCAYYTNSFCSRCNPGFALINYVCGAIDPNCLDFDESRNSCRQCREGMVALGPSCI